MYEDDILAFSDQLHRFIIQFRLDRIDTFSDLFKRISLLDLTIIRQAASSGEKPLKEIRDSIGIHNSTLSSAIKRLEKRGVLKKTASPEDGRSYIIRLTELGKKVHAEHMKTSILLAKKAMEAFNSDENRKEFIRLMGILVDNYDNDL